MSTMFVVSCRKDFWSATEFSTTDEIRELDLDTGTGPVITPAAFLEALAHKRITVLALATTTSASMCSVPIAPSTRTCGCWGFLGAASAPYEALVGFAWPGGATGVSFPLPVAAPTRRAALWPAPGGSAWRRRDGRSQYAQPRPRWRSSALRAAAAPVARHAWHFASAIDNESIEHEERYFDASRQAARCYVFHSKNDPVPGCGRLGDLFEFDTALGYAGPEDVRAMPSSWEALGSGQRTRHAGRSRLDTHKPRRCLSSSRCTQPRRIVAGREDQLGPFLRDRLRPIARPAAAYSPKAYTPPRCYRSTGHCNPAR